MNLPKNKNGKFFLINNEGKEVEFNHAIDVIEALFGVEGRDFNFKSEFEFPDGVDAQKPKKGKMDLLQKITELKKKPGRPAKVKEPEIEEDITEE